jgi:propanol-preferring alcohol dehydrogenase
MKAAVVHEFGHPLVIEDIPTPSPGPGQVLVRVETSGLCHTDIHAAGGDWPAKPAPPFIPGHEGVGIVERVGAGVTRVSEGDRVAIPWLGWACGACEACASGWETLCPSARYTGYSINGAFAEYVVADAAFVGVVPVGIDPLDAAPLTCAGVTTYKAVKVSGARSSDLVAIFGIGGLGHLALQYAKIAGATVAAVDLVEAKLEVAKHLGAEYTFQLQDSRCGRRDPGSGRCELRNRARCLARGMRAGLGQFEAQWHARARRTPQGQHHEAPHLRDGPEGDQGRRVVRGDETRSG